MALLHLLLVLLVALLCMLSVHIRSKPREEGPVAWLAHGGAVRGVWSRGARSQGAAGRRFSAFQGIPYALAPVGDLRFAPPKPARPWRGELSAVCEGPSCPQPSIRPLLVSYPSRVPSPGQVVEWLLRLPGLVSVLAQWQREDCLFVNVYVPEPAARSRGSNFPNGSSVLVWLHGGAFQIGDGSAEEYGPDLLVERDIVVVTLNYRLGVLGFLYGGPDSGAPGNMGLRDQVLALQWVRTNIAAFGGDPNKVTLWGESAGAISAHLHTLVAPAGQELFHRVILSSGVAILPWALQERPMHALRPLADALGWRPRQQPEHIRDLVRFLKKVPADQLVDASNQIKSVMKFPGNGMRLLRWLPVVEDVPGDPGERRFLTQSPISVLEDGAFKHIPTMLGLNSREGMVWLAGKSPRAVAALLRRFDRDFGLVIADLPLFPRRGRQPQPQEHTPYGELNDVQARRAAHLIRQFFFGRQRIGVRTLPAFLDLYSDLIFNIGVHEAAVLHMRWATRSNPLYLYRFSFDGQLAFLKRLIGSAVPGVGHADELGYLFNMKVLPPVVLAENSAEMVTRRRLVSLWTNFVKYGDPTPEEDGEINFVRWDPFSIENHTYLDIDENLSLRSHLFESRMKFWSDLYRHVLMKPLS